MARYTETEIYADANGLLGVVSEFVVHMPKNVAAMFGTVLRDISLDVMMLIRSANHARDKVPHLNTLLERVQRAEILLRVCRDKRFISNGYYARAIEHSTSVSKQAYGWRKQSESSSAT